MSRYQNPVIAVAGATGAVGEVMLSILAERLGPGLATDIHFNGLSFVIKTPRETGYAELLARLLETGVDVEYFRDISRSTKQLFE